MLARSHNFLGIQFSLLSSSVYKKKTKATMQLKNKLSLSRSRSQKAKRNQPIEENDELIQEVEDRAPVSQDAADRTWSESIEDAFHSFANGVLAATDGTAKAATDDSNRDDLSSQQETVVVDNLKDSTQNKKKRFPLLSNMKQKLKKNNRQQQVEIENLPEITEQLHTTTMPRSTPRSASKSDPLLTYKQWENFMDTVAFPEKSKPYLAFQEYVATQKQKSDEQKKIQQRKQQEASEERALEPKITWEEYLSKLALPNISWEEFMDTCAFPEKILGNKYRELLDIIATQRVARYRAETGIKDDRYLSIKEQTELPDDADFAKLFAMIKGKKNERLGIGMTQVDSREGIYVSHLVPGSKGASSGLKVGMRILSINSVRSFANSQEAITFIANTVGDVKIFAQPGVSPTVLEFGMDTIEFGVISLSDALFGDNKAKEKTAESEESSNEDDSEDEDDSTMASTVSDFDTLAGGDDWEANSISPTVHSEFSEDPIEAARKDKVERSRRSRRKSKKSKNKLSAVEEEHPAIKRVTTTAFEIFRESQDEMVGVSFVQSKDWPGVFVDSVASTSKFSPTGLKKGMKILRINGKVCPKSLNAAIVRVQKAIGKLELTVEVEEDAVEKLNQDVCIMASITKKKYESLSLQLQSDKRRGGLFVTDVNPFSKLATTELRPGHRIAYINGQRCPAEVDGCLALMDSIEGKLEIMAESVPQQKLRLDK